MPRPPVRPVSQRLSMQQDWRRRAGAARILVVGDVMLDRYWFGAVERISPEAPVPVARVQREQDRLGGAANAAL
ncbi:ADP-heptose synthase, partial [mine drainage metagenome]